MKRKERGCDPTTPLEEDSPALRLSMCTPTPQVLVVAFKKRSTQELARMLRGGPVAGGDAFSDQRQEDSASRAPTRV